MHDTVSCHILVLTSNFVAEWAAQRDACVQGVCLLPDWGTEKRASRGCGFAHPLLVLWCYGLTVRTKPPIWASCWCLICCLVRSPDRIDAPLGTALRESQVRDGDRLGAMTPITALLHTTVMPGSHFKLRVGTRVDRSVSQSVNPSAKSLILCVMPRSSPAVQHDGRSTAPELTCRLDIQCCMSCLCYVMSGASQLVS